MPGDPYEVQRILDRMTGDRAYDIGANQGGYTRGLASRFDEVIACEPAIESFEALYQLGLSNVTSCNLAVSDHCGEVTLNVQANSIQSGQLTTSSGPEDDGLSESTWGRLLHTRTVTCATLDALVDEYGAPAFVKIDTEGHEVQVIRGGLKSIFEYAPALYIEVHNRKFGDEIADLIGVVYPNLREVVHPDYPSTHWGHRNHYWLVAD